jgi:hypothetical protein
VQVRINRVSALIWVAGIIVAGLIVMLMILVKQRRTSGTLDEFTKAQPGAGSILVAELIAKLTPTFVAIIAGIWILYQYREFQSEQNQVSLQISRNQVQRAKIEQVLVERQAQIHGLDIKQKSAFHMETQPKLSIDVLSSAESNGNDFRYLISWEVHITNSGNRDVLIVEHEVEIFLGTQQNQLGESPSIAEVNHPGTEGLIHWTRNIHRKFSPKDLNGAALGPMSPGDKRFGGLSAIVHAPAGMWVYALTRLKLQGEQSEEDTMANWDYAILSGRNQGVSSKELLNK